MPVARISTSTSPARGPIELHMRDRERLACLKRHRRAHVHAAIPCPALSSSTWVCVTTACKLAVAAVIGVCQTVVVRPRCSGVHSAFATSPAVCRRRNWSCFRSWWSSRAPSGTFGGGGGAAKVVGERHQCAAVQHAVPVGKLIGDQKLSRHPLGRDVGDLHAHEAGKRRPARPDSSCNCAAELCRSCQPDCRAHDPEKWGPVFEKDHA